MNDNAMVERWNVIDSAAMAVAIESVLYRMVNGKPVPFDFNEAIKRGIAFLEVARDGGAIICGTPESSAFTGTLSPLKWSTDVYMQIGGGEGEGEGEGEELALYKSVVVALKQYRSLLEKVEKKKKLESESDYKTAQDAYTFFHELANELMKQADPITETYSHQI